MNSEKIGHVRNCLDEIIVDADLPTFQKNMQNFKEINDFLEDEEKKSIEYSEADFKRMKKIACSLANAIINGGIEQALDCFETEDITIDELIKIGVDVENLKDEKEQLIFY